MKVPHPAFRIARRRETRYYQLMQRSFENKKDLFKELVRTDFQLRYQDSLLGIVWVILKPFLLFLILYTVFSFLFGQKDPNYRLNLLLGIILFNFFAEATNLGMQSLLARANVILKVNFPREIALFSSLTQALISLAFNLIVFAILYVFSPAKINLVGLLVFVFYIVILAVLVSGISLFSSILFVRFRDLSAIWEVCLSILFYGTPIFYPLSIIPVHLQKWFLLNPLAMIVQNSRSALIKNALPPTLQTSVLIFVSLFLFLLGLVYFRKRVKKVAEDF